MAVSMLCVHAIGNKLSCKLWVACDGPAVVRWHLICCFTEMPRTRLLREEEAHLQAEFHAGNGRVCIMSLTPGVADVPEISAILVTPANNLNVMVHICAVGGVDIHAAMVVKDKVIWTCNTACDGPPLLDL